MKKFQSDLMNVVIKLFNNIFRREREGLLRISEIDGKPKNQRHKKADFTKIMKCFQRSSVGKSFADDPSELRPDPVLMLTVRYLFNKYIY